MVRLKHRYLLVDILYPSNDAISIKPRQDATTDLLQFHSPSPSKFDERALIRLIQASIVELFGDYGMGKVAGSLKVIYLSTATSTAIIRVSRDHVRLLWAALSFVTRLPKPCLNPCVIHVVRNSGTIRLAEEEAIKRAKDFVRRARSSDQALDFENILSNATKAAQPDVSALLDGDEMSEDE